MDRIFKRIKDFLFSKSLLVLLLAMLVIFPMAVMRKAHAVTEAVILSIGVTKVEDDYTIYAQIVSPAPEAKINENVEVVSISGDNLTGAINELAKKLGKLLSFENVQVVIFDMLLAKEDRLDVIEYLISKDTPLFCELLETDKDIEKVINDANELDDGGTKSLKNYAEFLDKNDENQHSVNILKFLNDTNKKIPKF